MKIKSARPPTAQIAITVKNFYPINGGGGCSKAVYKLVSNGAGNVSHKVVNGQDVFEVKAKVYLEFSVLAPSGRKLTYRPSVICFKQSLGKTDPLGDKAFPERSIVAQGNAKLLRVKDINPESADFDFSLSIQRSDGAVGVIDPKIRNRGINQVASGAKHTGRRRQP